MDNVQKHNICRKEYAGKTRAKASQLLLSEYLLEYSFASRAIFFFFFFFWLANGSHSLIGAEVSVYPPGEQGFLDSF
jgi:hypothetical protein